MKLFRALFPTLLLLGCNSIDKDKVRSALRDIENCQQECGSQVDQIEEEYSECETIAYSRLLSSLERCFAENMGDSHGFKGCQLTEEQIYQSEREKCMQIRGQRLEIVKICEQKCIEETLGVLALD